MLNPAPTYVETNILLQGERDQ